ncbi:MAG TPA: TM0106 family RecB-like putative nuclease, partial [Tepidisphaeraceae bacterium]|nr:TM0106 family RecB-like putative nuclease [Tepidisphaeraceae bacterium]
MKDGGSSPSFLDLASRGIRERTSISITAPLFASFVKCRYKAHLQAAGESGAGSAYERLVSDLDRDYREQLLRGWRKRLGAAQTIDSPLSLVAAVRQGYRLITNASATAGRFSVYFEALEHVADDPSAGTHGYVPLIFTHREKVTGQDKLLAVFFALALAEATGTPTPYAGIIHGPGGTVTKVAIAKPAGITEVGRKAGRLVDELAAQIEGPPPPALTLNDHCPACEFRDRCRAAAVEKDDISLLRGLSGGEIEQWRRRGIFTVTQLSYTFRAKSVTGKRAGSAGRHLPALQALAVREKKIYLARPLELPVATAARVFLDVEGVPDRDFYYLIGAVVEKDGKTWTHSLWADDADGERRIWEDLIAILGHLGPFTAYHYGRYEQTFLDHMVARYGILTSQEAVAKHLKTESADVLASMAGCVYFPANSRNLKEIGSLVGASWSDPAASGLQSLVWRHEWEASRDPALKHNLFQYNQEDCFALRAVTDVLAKLSRGEACSFVVVGPDELPANAVRQFGMGNPATPEIGRIIKCAYFAYQTNKVLFRTDPRVRESVRRQKVRWRKPKVNKVVTFPRPERCPHCGGEKLHMDRKLPLSKTVFDLRFSASGVRRWVVRYETLRFRCDSCLRTCFSSGYPKHGGHIGHGLSSWAVHAHVALRQSFEDVTSGINDAFGYSFPSPILYRIKPRMARKYEPTQELLLAKLRAGPVLYVDETRVQLGSKTGYVWAFTNLHEVVYLYSASRDGTVLGKVLEGFNGVLVSDFFSVYDSPTCEQQKCVVHFVRDLNDDLKQHPLDGELAELAKGFTAVFTPIIATIDRYGLTQYHLHKHKADADRYLAGVAGRTYQSKVATGYQRRLGKYGQRL